MEFGVPKIRHEKVEKYPNIGVFTLFPTGDGKARKVELNVKAIELLGIEGANNKISFSFSGKDIFVVNTSSSTSIPGLRIGKTTNAFSDKKHYDYIKKLFAKNNEDEVELKLIETENNFGSNPIFQLIPNFNEVSETTDELINENTEVTNTVTEELNDEIVSEQSIEDVLTNIMIE